MAGRPEKIAQPISLFMCACRKAFAVSTPAVSDLLAALAGAMEDRRVRWYLSGAQAAIIWGSPRLSADVDVTIEIDPVEVNGYVQAMTDRGFDVVINDAGFLERTRVIPFVHRASGMPLDVVLGGRGLEEDFLRRAIDVDVDGTVIPVISPEDLIVTKTLAGRPKDIEDIRGVIAERRDSLDDERIRMLLRLLEEALAPSDLLPVFERAWADA
jgi:predicted nucleotidyltransferase